MKKKSDYFYNFLTYLSAGIGCFILGSILVYIFSKGFSSLNLKMFTSNYWSETFLVSVDGSKNSTSYDLPNEGYCSTSWGICLEDAVTSQKEKIIRVTYVADDSPLKSLSIQTAGADQGKAAHMELGYQIEKIEYVDKSGTIGLAGKILSQNAEEVVQTLDNSVESINSIYMKSTGGGIRGSLIATLWLIVISLVIALPIGISSAIYLNEYAVKGKKITKLIRQGTETLTGVPSIVYGLMGVSVLFPITQLFGATTTSILLGSLTMSIILLPTIIRSTEEALLVVPAGLRDASLSLGATKSQTIFKVTLPCCINGILTGVLLGIGRVIGESAALIYTMGTFINDYPKVTSQGTSLSLMIWSFMSGEQPNFELACAISIIILGIVLILNIIVKLIGNRLSKELS